MALFQQRLAEIRLIAKGLQKYFTSTRLRVAKPAFLSP
jgi:hypothetical protein